MEGDIRIVRHNADALMELPISVAGKSQKFRTVYVLLRDFRASWRLNQLFGDFQKMAGVPVAVTRLHSSLNCAPPATFERLACDSRWQ